jgi:FMN-dependent NADH-azoreductase
MTGNSTRNILRIDSSARTDDSVSRALGDTIIERLSANAGDIVLTHRDLSSGLPHIDAAWVAANFTPAGQRSPKQRARLALSDSLIAELGAADALVITAPIYNFSIPSVLKVWVDQICRAGLTFRYTAEGPQGLLRDRPVYLAMASGGVPFGSPVDFASTYLQQIFHFVGIDDVRLIGAERLASDADAAQAGALAALERWLPVSAAAVA